MIHLAPAKLATLADLTRPGSLAPLGELLVKAWDNVLFYDPAIELAGLPKPRRDLLTKGQSADYWASLKPDNSRKQRQRAQFREWTALYSADPLPCGASWRQRGRGC